MIENPRRQCQGFTLLELMLVVTVLAIILVMAIPALMTARIVTNEASAISTLRSVATVSEQYRIRFRTYASSLANLQAEGYVDDKVGSGTKSGYIFTYAASGSDDFTCNGDPVTLGTTGYRYFFVDSSGVIRFSSTGTATSTSSAIN